MGKGRTAGSTALRVIAFENIISTIRATDIWICMVFEWRCAEQNGWFFQGRKSVRRRRVNAILSIDYVPEIRQT